MSSYFILILLIVLVVLLGLLAFAYMSMKRKNEKTAEDAIFLTSKKTNFDFWYNMYTTLDSIVFTKNLLGRLYRQYEILDPGNEKEVKAKAVKVTMTVIGMDFAVIFAVILMKPSIYKIAAAVWFIYNATNMIIDRGLSKQESGLQRDFSAFISEVRHNYFKHGMVEEAIYESFDKLSKRMQGHATLIYKTLTAKDPVEALRKYSDSAPSSYMKQFVSICAITMKYGDKTVNGQSLFLADIKDLKQMMDSTVLQKESVKDKFRFLDVIVFLPIFLMDVVKKWSISVFPSLQKFYAGKQGILLIAGAFVCSLVVMMVLNHFKNGKRVDRSQHPVLEYLLELKPIARFVHNYEETYFSGTYRLRMLLKTTGSSYTSGMLLLRRLIGGAVAFVCTIAFLAMLNLVQINLAIGDVREVADKGSGTTEYQNIAVMALTTHYLNEYLDYDLIDIYNNEVMPGAGVSTLSDANVEELKAYWTTKFSDAEVEMTDDELIAVIRSYNVNHSAESTLATIYYGNEDDPLELEGLDELTLRKVTRDFSKIMEFVTEPNAMQEEYIYEIVADGVYDHVKDYQDASFKWWYVLLAVLAAILFYHMPVIIMKINAKELQDFMEDEVIQFQSIIMILMYIDQMTVASILEEMSRFAFCFEDSIRKCVNHIASGEEAALRQLMIDEPFEPFVRLVENLIACDRIGVQQAFNEIDIERQNYIERRKQEGAIKLNNKAAIAQYLSFLPMYFVIGLYMVYPFIMEAMTSLTDSMAGL